MRRLIIVFTAILALQFSAASVLPAQQDKLAGRWEGKVQSPEGELATNITFLKEGDTYSGKMPSLRSDNEIELKEIKIDGSKVTAKAYVETPQGTLTINYIFTLDQETLAGQGALDFGGQSFTFDIHLKRVSTENQAASVTRQPQAQPQPQGRGQGQGQGQTQGQRARAPSVPQPQQKQSIDYFTGQWTFKYIGRDSALGPAPRDCTVDYKKSPDGKTLESITECTFEGGAYQVTSLILFDDATKTLTSTEKLRNGIVLNTRGDWKSPISIRYSIDPIKVKDQKLLLRRTVSIVSAHSYTVAEELSENGGPFVRLGSAVVVKAQN
ncbi:MAG: hypothetical protein L0220_06890 [Acidobacteria bacterium]|nr:hypothetical protein [Acidobacteriota bacterium]